MAVADDSDLAWALKAHRDANRQGGYSIAADYYDGNHRLTFATQKFRSVFGRLFGAFADNLCPAVVDSISDRLKITGVASEVTPEAATAAWDIWQRNRMDVRAPETHHEALLTGDGFALVWPNKSGEAVIWSLAASGVAVSYDPNVPGLIRRAARLWQDEDDQRWHLDLYYPDRVERYVSVRASTTRGTMPSGYNARSFEPDSGTEGADAAGVIEHALGHVPIVHFPNRRYHRYGVSELAGVVPLQDALNKACCDMLVTMEFSAFRQRWATGVEVDEDGKPPEWAYGDDRMIVAEKDTARFGSFDSSDLEQFVAVQENFRSEIARVSGTPLHYLFITRGDFPSGEAMNSAEARFTRKVENRQSAFGNQWEDLLGLALRIERKEFADVQLSLEWEDASPTPFPTGKPGPNPEPAAAPDANA